MLQVRWRRSWTLWTWRRASVNWQTTAAVNLPLRPAPYWPPSVTPAKPAHRSQQHRISSAVRIPPAYSMTCFDSNNLPAQIPLNTESSPKNIPVFVAIITIYLHTYTRTHTMTNALCPRQAASWQHPVRLPALKPLNRGMWGAMFVVSVGWSKAALFNHIRWWYFSCPTLQLMLCWWWK